MFETADLLDTADNCLDLFPDLADPTDNFELLETADSLDPPPLETAESLDPPPPLETADSLETPPLETADSLDCWPDLADPLTD